MVRHIALVSQTPHIDASELAVVSAALQKQVTRDLTPIWEVEATVDAFPKLDDVPSGYYSIIVRDDVTATTGVKGVHHDPDKQPFALVQFTDAETWSVHASHECLEMLVDPSLGKVVAGDSIKAGQGRVQYSVEVCDPCQDPAFSYPVNGVRVCDFVTPHYFDPLKASGVRYSFAESVREPRQVVEGGYLAWLEPVHNEWWIGFVLGGVLDFVKVGPLNASLSIREFIDSISGEIVRPGRRGRRRMRHRADRAAVRAASVARARRLQYQIDSMLAQRPQHTARRPPRNK